MVGTPLTLADVMRVANDGAPVALAYDARDRIVASREYIERLVAEGRTVYGVTTGFGKLANVRIAPADVQQLQRNLVRSHAMGVGEPLSQEVVRAMLLLRAQSLSLGFSGIRVEVIELLIAMLNHGIHPIIPSQGSVGASGDLAPLAHMALALIGEGKVEFGDAVLPAADALRRGGPAPVTLEAKEGLALINGTQAMTAIGALAVSGCARARHRGRHRRRRCRSRRSRDRARHSIRASPRCATIRAPRQPPPTCCAISADSPIHASHADCDKIQDAYSLRCVPQVHGASRDALRHAAEVLTREINAVTDNPLVFAEADTVISAGNFHGQPVALVMDYAKIAIAELANIAERRIEHMMDPAVSGLPAFLAHQGGLHSGLMISQYTAASLVSENKVLAHPASVDSIPTSANQEDHVSMGTITARQCAMILENARWVIAIEVLSATQALEFHKPLEAGPGVGAAVKLVRSVVPPLEADRIMTGDLAAVRDLIVSRGLRDAVEKVVGALR